MAVEDDILKTLIRIEKALAQGSTTSGLGRTTAPTVAGGADRGRRGANPRGPIDRDASDQKKVFRAATAALQKITNSSDRLDRSFNTLNKTILATRGNFVSMNRTMRQMPRAMQVAQPPPAPTPEPTPAQDQRRSRTAEEREQTRRRRLAALEEKKGRRVNTNPWKLLPGQWRDFGEGIMEGFRDAQRRNRVRVPGEGTPAAGGRGGRGGRGGGPGRPGPAPTPAPNPADFGPQLPPPPRPPHPADVGPLPLPPPRPVREGFDQLVGGLRGGSRGLVAFTVALAGAIVPLTKDILRLEAAGISSSNALGGLYIDAIRAGMSLADYTKLLQSSSAAVTRAGSMAEFNETLQNTNSQLAGIGIFGKSANELSAQLATSATALGVPQDKLAEATSAQVAIFARLRQTSMMTAEEFTALSKNLMSNQTVQSQLLGMGPLQRAARMEELMQIKNIGRSMGATKEASDALGDALIATRNLTAPKRFEAAGRIRQAGAMFGMDAGATERAAQLSRRKIRTEAENLELVTLLTPLEAAMQAAMQSGNIAQENMAEQMYAMFDGTLGDVMRKAGNVGLTAESGPAGVNKDFAKGTSNLIQAAGMLMTVSEGLSNNDFIKGIGIGAIGLMIGRGLGGGITSGLTGMLGSINNIMGGAINMVRGGMGRLMSLLNPMNWLRGIQGLRGAGGIMNTITSVFNSVRGLFSGLSRLGPLMGGVLTFMKRFPLIGAFISGVTELFTGNTAAAFNADGYNWAEKIGNIVFAMANNFIAGIGGIGDWVMKFFFGVETNMENWVNRFMVSMRKMLLESLAWVTDKIPGMGRVTKYLRGAAEDSDTVLKQLEADKTATVSSIGEARQKEIDSTKKSADATKALADKTEQARSRITAANAGVLTTTTGISAGIVATARAVATPVSPTPQTVTSPDVNKPEPAPGDTAEEKADAEAAATTPQTDAIVAQLVAMTNILTSILSADQLQAAGLTALAANAGRPVFTNNETKFDLLQGGRYTG